MEVSFEHLLRDLVPQVLGSLVRRYRDFAAAEDAVQEALVAASLQWKADTIPDNPRAWLTQVASRRLTDEIRSNAARRRREDEQALSSGYTLPHPETTNEEDDTLILMYMCCHPALTPSSAIALTLRAVGGLTTSEIAHAFLVPEATMAQRISRAKQTVKNAGAVFAMPDPEHRIANLRNVMHVLYLMFNEGYSASSGDQVQRTDLSEEAIRITRLLYSRLSRKGASDVIDSELTGLLALMLLTDARRMSRTGARGEMIPLDRQDRTLWDQKLIAEGVALLTAALGQGSVGPYQLQAAIAAVHDEASTVEETDWSQIAALYDLLLGMSDNPMVRLNYAVAVTMTRGSEAGLQLLARLGTDEVLRAHHRFYAVRAHLHEMAGNHLAAHADYQAAAEKTASLPERTYLLEQAARTKALGESSSSKQPFQN